MKYIGLILMFFAQGALASNWKPIPNTKPNSTFVDVSSIAQVGKYRKAWFLWTAEAEEDGNAYSNFKKYKSTRSLNYYSCDERTSGTWQTLFYSDTQGSGDYLGRWAPLPRDINYLDVAPDTLGEVMLEYVCNYKKK